MIQLAVVIFYEGNLNFLTQQIAFPGYVYSSSMESEIKDRIQIFGGFLPG
jgi:hypothetical protein